MWYIHTATAAKSLQSCPTLCDPIDGLLPGCPVPGILQARTLEWVAISFSSSWKWKVKVKSLSRVRLLATSWTAAYQAPLSMGFSGQEYWSGVSLPSPYIHTMDYYSAIKRDKVLIHAKTWRNLENMMIHLRRQSQRPTYCINPFMCVLVAQACPTLCHLMDCSLPGSSVCGILQARILEWVAISLSRESSRSRDRTQVSCFVGRFFTIWATRKVQFHLYK